MAGNQEVYEKAMKQGHSAAWDQEWDRAAGFYRQALAEFPDEPKALTNLGLALYEMQRFEEALSCYQQAAAGAPADPLPREKESQICEKLGALKDATRAALQAADLYMRSGEAEKAIQNWQRVVGFSPENISAHSRLAITFERLANKPAAINEYLAIASLVQQAGDPSKAAQVVNYALQILPENNAARQALALLKNNQPLPRPTRARRTSSEVVTKTSQPGVDKGADNLDPVSEARQKALITLAGFLFEQVDEGPQEPAKGRGLSSIARGAAPITTQQSERARIFTHLNRCVEAQTQADNVLASRELQQALDAGLDNPAAFFNQGLLQYNQGDWANALKNLQNSVKHNDFALASRLLIGDCLRKLGRLPQASIEYLEALKIADSASVPAEKADEIRQLYEPLIDAQSRQTDNKELAALCDNVASQLLSPGWKQHLEHARQQLASQEAGQTSIPVAEVLLSAHSGQVVEMLSTVRALASKGMVRSAMEEAFYALKYAPLYLPLHIQIGELLLQEGMQAEAILKFKTVSRIFNIRGEMAQANRLMRRILQLNPMDMNVRSQLIEQLTSQGQTDDAIREYLDLADIYYHQGEFAPCRQTFMNALRLAQKSTADHSWSVQILKRMADIDMQRLDWRQALRVLEQIRTMQPDDEKVRASLIDLNFRLGQDAAALNEVDSFRNYLDSKGQQESAIEFLKGMVNEHTNKLELHKRLADAYRQAKRMPEAVAELVIMADLLFSAGNRSGAAVVVQAIIKLNPPNLADYQQLLQKLQAK